jgi:hypothetical protein
MNLRHIVTPRGKFTPGDSYFDFLAIETSAEYTWTWIRKRGSEGFLYSSGLAGCLNSTMTDRLRRQWDTPRL